MSRRDPHSTVRRRATGLAVVALAAGAVAAGPALGETVQASGTGRADVQVTRPLTQAKISRAVERARDMAAPRAFVNARTQADRYAAAARLTLGGILAVEEPPSSPYFYYGNTVARFGGNRYCGYVTSVKRRTVNGKRRVVSRTKTYKCFKPDYVTITIAVTYAATPAPAPAP